MQINKLHPAISRTPPKKEYVAMSDKLSKNVTIFGFSIFKYGVAILTVSVKFMGNRCELFPDDMRLVKLTGFAEVNEVSLEIVGLIALKEVMVKAFVVRNVGFVVAVVAVIGR